MMNDVHDNGRYGHRCGGERSNSPSNAEEINRVLYTIADAVNASEDRDALYRTIHQVLGTVIDATNFLIAIVDQRQRTLFFPYFVDEIDEDFSPLSNFDASDSLTGLVVTEKRAIFLDSQALRDRAASKGIWGPVPLVWLGVPLTIRDEVIGVMAVQHYSDPHRYSREDLRLLTAISHQTAVAIDRKRSLERLKRSEETYRNMFLGAPVGLFSAADLDRIFEPFYSRKVMSSNSGPGPSGEEAVEMLRREPVALVILDMLMAGTGVERATHLRRNPAHQSPPEGYPCQWLFRERGCQGLFCSWCRRLSQKALYS
jgi:GAF domain